MENGVRNVMQEIMCVDALFLSILATIWTQMPVKNTFTIQTLFGFHKFSELIENSALLNL